MAGNRSIAEVTFHNGSTTPSNGLEYTITCDGSSMNLDFIGSGSFSATIQGKVSILSDWDDILAFDTTTGNLSTIVNNFHTWNIDCTAWTYLRVKLTSITGLLTTVGKLVG